MLDLRTIEKLGVNPNFSSLNIILKSVGITEQVVYETSQAVADETPSISRRDEVAALLNEDRLSRLSPSSIDAYLKELGTPRDSMPFKGSDDDLVRYIKSRHIQAPCELQAYSEMLANTVDAIQDRVKDAIADSSEPAETPQSPKTE